MNWRADSTRQWEKFRAGLLAEQQVPMRIAVLAAHPDDEVIGASAVLGRCSQPVVIFLTDGVPRDPQLWPPGMSGSREEYAETRRAEARAALANFAVSGSSIFWLGAVDQEAIFNIVESSAQLLDLLRTHAPDVLITHAYEGGHPDHDAAALAAKLTTARLQADCGMAVVEMTSYHARDRKCVTGEFLNSNPASELLLDLSTQQREAKSKAFEAYASQRLVLGSFSIDRERLRIAPDYDFSKPPHLGKLWYECMAWQLTGERWRELAAQAVANFAEHACR
jgi:LmbE family N-acetylglucosaminyl deacetylase